MSMPQALIARAQPDLVAARAQAIVATEIAKGCQLDLSPNPLALEPHFQELATRAGLLPQELDHDSIIEAIPDPLEIIRLQAWIAPDQELDWTRCESFLKQLQTATNRVGFEVRGNCRSIALSFFCRQKDLPILRTAFEGEYHQSELIHSGTADPIGENEGYPFDLTFNDYFPSPPYSHLLTCPGELKASPLESLLGSLGTIESPAEGFYQALFQPVDPAHNWHQNVETLLDLEYSMKLVSGFQPWQRYSQQAPSGDLHHMAGEVITKAHNDKPFFCLALRVGVINGGEDARTWLSGLSTFINLFQHGGRPLNRLTDQDYANLFSSAQMHQMFRLGLTYRPGFLVNSMELAGPVHLPGLRILEHRKVPFIPLDVLSMSAVGLNEGTLVGFANYGSRKLPIRISQHLRKRHTHVIGRPGTGKSSLLEHMIKSDIEADHGVAVLDPHGDLVERLLCLIPEDKIDKVVYLNPGDPDWIPIWNPFDYTPGQDIGRTSDDMVRAIQSFVSSGSWGDRMEHILRNICFSLIPMPHSTIFDLASLLRNKSEESKQLRQEILKYVDNESVRQFWLQDYDKYGKDEMGPPRNKLSKLLVSGSVSLMLSQPDNWINLRQLMDEGLILLVNLSTVGSMAREVLGCFILSLLHLNALSRSSIPREERKQFDIYCDEAHRFMTDALEDLIAETRKYAVSLNLAHQYMSQFGQSKIDAFSSVGASIIFNVDERDARFLTKDMRGKVKPEDLTCLELAEAVGRIGTEMIRFTLPPPLETNRTDIRDQIIALSRERYYRSLPEVRKMIRRRNERWVVPFRDLSAESRIAAGGVEEFVYDEFD